MMDTFFRYDTWTCYRRGVTQHGESLTSLGTVALHLQPLNASGLQSALGIIPAGQWRLFTEDGVCPSTFFVEEGNVLRLAYSGEVLEAGDGSTKIFTGTLKSLDRGIKRGSITILATVGAATKTITESAFGILSTTGVTGTIDYVTGDYALTFITEPDNDTDITGSWIALPELDVVSVNNYAPDHIEIIAKGLKGVK